MLALDNSVNRSIFQAMAPYGITLSPTTGVPTDCYAGFHVIADTTVSFDDGAGTTHTINVLSGMYLPIYVENFSSTALGDCLLVNFQS